MRRMAVENDAIAEFSAQPLPEAVAQDSDAIHRSKIAGKPACGAESDGQNGALGPGPPSVLVPGTVNERFERDAAADEQSADPFRSIELVAGDRQQVGSKLVHGRCNFSNRL